MFNTPILFLIFNRPDTTRLVFEKIREIKPKKLFIAADGPRLDKVGEELLCNQSRMIVLENIDWDCEVYTLFRNTNLGCGIAVSGAITWFFEHVEEGIILEDDCLPNDSFFYFCETMLINYRYDNSIKHITGSCYVADEKYDYILSKLPFIWGWATWKRAWKNYNLNLSNDSYQEKEYILFKNLQSNIQTNFWLDRFAELEKFGCNFTWDYQWFYAIWKSAGYVIAPTRNLVSNIGFSLDATHTTDVGHHLSNLPTQLYNSRSFENFAKFSKERETYIFNFYFLNSANRSHYNVSKSKFSLKTKMYCFLREILIKSIPELKEIKHEQLIFETTIDSTAKVHGQTKLFNSRIGAYSYLSTNCTLNNTLVGKYCSIGPNLISGWGIHPLNGISTSPMFYSTAKQNGYSLTNESKVEETMPIIIGNDVFIGMNVTILDGVSIGDGAVIGAGAVVSKDIPPYAIAYGNPINVVKYRFDDTTIQIFLKLKWWDWNPEKLRLIEEKFFDVENFIKQVSNVGNSIN